MPLLQRAKSFRMILLKTKTGSQNAVNKLLPLEIKESISSGDQQDSKYPREISSEEHAVIPEGERHKVIGDCPEVEAIFGKVQLRCLLDSGSQVTTRVFTTNIQGQYTYG